MDTIAYKIFYEKVGSRKIDWVILYHSNISNAVKAFTEWTQHTRNNTYNWTYNEAAITKIEVL